MLVPVIVDLAENHWHKVLQESLIALKTILKEIDPIAFDEALKLTQQQKKIYSVKQDPDDRSNLDKKWEKLNGKIKSKNPDFVEPPLPFQPNHLIKDFNYLYAQIYDKEKFIAA